MAWNTHVTPAEAVNFLNTLLELDRTAVTQLVFQRVSCNRALADHETVQVSQAGPEFFKVGLLGILNGLFGVSEAGYGRIAAHLGEGGVIEEFALVEEDQWLVP